MNRRRGRSRSADNRSRDNKKTPTNGTQNVERWPNDKYFENDRRRDASYRRRDDDNNESKFERRDDRMGNESRKRHGLGYDKQTKRQFEHDIFDTRRTKREVIGREGTAVVWGKSPSPSEM